MNWRISRYEESKRQLVDASTAILDKSTAEGRDLSPAENDKIKANRAELDALQAKISKEKAYLAEPVGEPIDTRFDVPAWELAGGKAPSGMAFHASNGQTVRALRSNESFCSQVGDGEPNYCGRMTHAWLTGRTDSPLFHAAFQQGNVDTSGGFLLEPRLSTLFVDIARAASVCVRAGAQTIPMQTPEMHIARALSDPTAYWRGEGVAVPATVRNLGRFALRARTLACIVPISIELLEDCANAPAMLEEAMGKAMGLKLDQACLAGTGAEAEPLGVRNVPTVNTVTSVGTPTDYSEVSAAVRKILAANFNGDPSSLAWIMNPRDASSYDGLQDTLHQPLRPTPWASKLQQLTTTSVSIIEGTGADGYAVVGDFSQMLIGMRTSGIVLRRLPAGQVAELDPTVTHNAVSELKEFLVAYLRADVCILRPTWFSLMTGITASA